MRKTLSFLYRKFFSVLKQATSFFSNPFRGIQFSAWYFKMRNHTHASVIDLLHLQQFIINLHQEGKRGTIVECGSWRGGSAALMQKRAQSLGWQNEIYVFDSFEGFPAPAAPEVDGVKAQGIKEGKYNWIKADQEDVQEAFSKLGVFNQRVHVVKGWFQDTTPGSDADQIVLLHCDGDLYESTRTTLTSFYHKVVSGGYVVSNDYGDIWIGAKKAFDEWIQEYCPEVIITKIPGGGAFFRKP